MKVIIKGEYNIDGDIANFIDKVQRSTTGEEAGGILRELKEMCDKGKTVHEFWRGDGGEEDIVIESVEEHDDEPTPGNVVLITRGITLEVDAKQLRRALLPFTVADD